MLDNFIYKYRYFIGIGLAAIIIAGTGLLYWNKISTNKKSQENAQVQDLQKQNDELRAQLSDQAKAVAGTTTSQNTGDKININTADAAELDKLPGIGPAKAADIISYRESHGGFSSIEELKNIKGIGDKTFENLKNSVTVGE